MADHPFNPECDICPPDSGCAGDKTDVECDECGEEIEWDDYLDAWQHSELVACTEPTPASYQ